MNGTLILTYHVKHDGYRLKL